MKDYLSTLAFTLFNHKQNKAMAKAFLMVPVAGIIGE